MSVYALIFTSICVSACSRIIWRLIALRDVGEWTTLIVCTVAAVPLLVVAVPLPDLQVVPTFAYLMLIINALIWVLAGWFDMAACRHLSPTVDSLYSSLTLIFATVGGVFVFGEELSVLTYIGITLIFGAAILHDGFGGFCLSKGVLLKLGAVCCIAAAMIVDKALVQVVSPDLVTYSGFALPALMYLVIGRKEIPRIWPDIKRCQGLILLTPLCSAISYCCLMRAFAMGKLSVASPLLETTVAVVFIMEIFVFKLRDGLWKKALACLSCVVGAGLVCWA